MEDFKLELEELKVNIAQNKPPKGEVVFYGSSSFRLWDTLEQDLQVSNIANLAFGGSTLEACVYYFETIVLPFEPKSIVFYGGDNDIGNGKTAEEVLFFFEALYEKIRKHLPTIPFTFLSIKPSPSRVMLLSEIQKANEMIASKAKELSNVNYIDIHSGMLNPDSSIKGQLFIEDELHLNKEGYAIWAQELVKNREEWFK